MSASRNWHLFIFILILLNIFNWIGWVEFKLGIPQIVKYVLSIIVIGTLLYYQITNSSQLIFQDSYYLVFLWFILYSLILLITSMLRFDGLIYLQRSLADRVFLIPYLLPLIILFVRFDLKFFSALFNIASLLMIPVLFILLYTLLFDLDQKKWVEQFERINMFNLASGFILLTAHISKKRYISRIIIIYYILFIVLSLIYGRRGGVISCLLILAIMIFLRLRSPLYNIKYRIKLYLAGILIFMLVMAFGYIIKSSYAFERGFSKEGFQESRGEVFTDFFNDFTSTGDWLFGRGIQGRVYRSIYAGGTLDIVEQGFLTVILRGGLVYLIPFVLIFLRASWLGYFRSKNDMVKALAILVFLHLALMFYFNLPDYSTYYIFIWISITACFNKRMRNYSNDDIYKAINEAKN